MTRVMARVSAEEQLETLEAEIAREVAQALGRSEDRVNLALAELDLLKARYDRAAPHERRAHAETFNAQRKVAQERLRNLAIHREAVGFRRNQVLAELYPIPPKITCW